MHKTQIIDSLNIIASDLDRNGSYKLAEKIDNTIIKIALLSDEGAKVIIEPHPGKKDVRRNLGIPPDNIFESLQLKIEDLVGKLKSKKTTKKRTLTSSYINSIFEQYQQTGYVNSSFIDFLVKSASFSELVYRMIQNRPEQHETWKKLFEDIQLTVSKTLNYEVKKLDNNNIAGSWNKTQVYSALTSLSLLQDFLPTELISEIKAYKEFLDERNNLEQHIKTISEIGDPYEEDQTKAEEELKEYTMPPEEKVQKLIQSSTKGKNMNKRTIIASLNDIANELDNNGLYKEASTLTNVMKKLAQEMMPEDAEATFEPMTDVKDANTNERILTFVNRAMADHNAHRDGWITLRTLIKNDPILNRDKNTFLNSLKAAEKLFNSKLDMIGGEKGKFKDDSGSLGGRLGPNNILPYRDRSPKPGGLYSGEKPVKNQFSYNGGGLP